VFNRNVDINVGEVEMLMLISAWQTLGRNFDVNTESAACVACNAASPK
jgi:hypothetical protein